jgi:hypothetical protein
MVATENSVACDCVQQFFRTYILDYWFISKRCMDIPVDPKMHSSLFMEA